MFSFFAISLTSIVFSSCSIWSRNWLRTWPRGSFFLGPGLTILSLVISISSSNSFRMSVTCSFVSSSLGFVALSIFLVRELRKVAFDLSTKATESSFSSSSTGSCFTWIGSATVSTLSASFSFSTGSSLTLVRWGKVEAVAPSTTGSCSLLTSRGLVSPSIGGLEGAGLSKEGLAGGGGGASGPGNMASTASSTSRGSCLTKTLSTDSRVKAGLKRSFLTVMGDLGASGSMSFTVIGVTGDLVSVKLVGSFLTLVLALLTNFSVDSLACCSLFKGLRTFSFSRLEPALGLTGFSFNRGVILIVSGTLESTFLFCSADFSCLIFSINFSLLSMAVSSILAALGSLLATSSAFRFVCSTLMCTKLVSAEPFALTFSFAPASLFTFPLCLASTPPSFTTPASCSLTSFSATDLDTVTPLTPFTSLFTAL